VVKPEWGTKRTCPKCGERFYDLGNSDPVVCIACGVDFKPEPILKTKQPIIEAEEKKSEDEIEDVDDEDIDLDADDDDAVSLDDDDDTEVKSMVDTSLAEDES
jgi:hypothetical protein